MTSVSQSRRYIAQLDDFVPRDRQQLQLVQALRLGREVFFDRIALNGDGRAASKLHGLTNTEGMRAITLYMSFAFDERPIDLAQFASLRAFEIYAGLRDITSGEYGPMFRDKPYEATTPKSAEGGAT